MNELRKLDITEVAKLLRKELRETFQGVKFSVRIDRFSMGESIDIRWLDGPASVLVDRIADKYSDIDRDPSTGEILSGGNRYVNATREYSPAIQKQITEEFSKGKYPGYPTEWNVLCMTDFYQGKAPRTYTREEINPATESGNKCGECGKLCGTNEFCDVDCSAKHYGFSFRGKEEVQEILEQARDEATKLRYIQ
jgi:hypothetical protein